MNEVLHNTIQTPIEIALGIDENGMTTAKKLYEFLELRKGDYSRWCKTNILENEFAEENVDYFPFRINAECGGQATTDYKLTSEFAKKLSMASKSARGEEARQYFVTVEDKAKEMVVNRNLLSPQLQLMNMLCDNISKQELEQKRQSEQLKAIESKVSGMKEAMTTPIGDWRAEINSKVREISINSGIDYQLLFSQMYGELETTAHCSLQRLQNNKVTRMEKAGNTKTAIKNATTKIAIVEEKPQLKAIFESIVRRYAMSYL